MNKQEKLFAAREKVVEAIAKNIDLYGIAPSVGRLYGTMYFHNQPMTLDQMKEELGMSKTSMSTAVRQLSELRMVHKVWKKGVRKDLYQVEDDWHQNFLDLFTLKWRPVIQTNVLAIKKSITELETILNDENASTTLKNQVIIDINKLNKALKYYTWLDILVDHFETKQIYEFIPKE